MNKLIIVLCCLAAAATIVSGNQFADSDSSNIEQLAELVCKTTKGTDHLIGKVSTFNEIIDFLGEVSSQHHLYECGVKYLDSLQQLVHVVETASDNVCGEEKLALLEDFHHKFVSKTRKDRESQKGGLIAPKMAKLFFMQYATQVSSACEQSFIKSVAEKKHTFPAEEQAQVDKLKKFTDLLGMSDLSQGYQNIYLLWNMIDSLNLGKIEKFSKYLAPEGHETRINFQMKDARFFMGVQTICRYRLKPIYSKTLLPVLRLIDMGYYPQGKQLLDGINSEDTIKSLFYSSQLCETILPVGMFSDDKLETSQFISLTIEDASKLSQPHLKGVEQLAENKPTVEIAPVSLDSQELDSESTLAREIKSNVDNRGKVVNRLLRQMWGHLKSGLKSAFKGFKMFHKNGDQKLEAVDEKALEHLEKDTPLQVEEVNEEGALTRRKRDFFGPPDEQWIATPWYEKVGIFFLGIVLIVYLIILYAIKIALLGLPTLVSMFWYLPGRADKKLNKFVDWVWNLGNPLEDNFGFVPIFSED